MENAFEPGPPAWFTWQGYRWYRRPSGHYADRTGGLLHVAVWERHHGERLPVDRILHHIDHDPANNDITNLRITTRAEHLAEHGPGSTHPPEVRETISRAQRSSWATRKPRKHNCAQCNGEFESTGQRAKFCSTACAATFRRVARRAEWSG